MTYEASNYFYTYNAVIVNLLDNGKIDTNLDVASLDILKYRDWYDWIRMVGEIMFMGIIFTMIYFVFKRKFKVLRMYKKWESEEVNHLSKVEKEQRRKHKPEVFRKIWSLINFFTIFEVLFFIFIIITAITWMIFIIKNQKLTKDYGEGNLNIMYNDFYNAKELFDDYKIILSFASICLSFNLLSYFFMIKHTLADSKLDIMYFLLFYIILILGFVSMTHFTFGSYIKEYHTFGDAMVECFSIILGDFDYLALEEVSPLMAFFFFYTYNIIFVFILANMLLAIMNTAYIQSNAKKQR